MIGAYLGILGLALTCLVLRKQLAESERRIGQLEERLKQTTPTIARAYPRMVN